MVVGGLIGTRLDKNLMKIKVCGLTEPQNALAVTKCGIDAIGLVFYNKSPRYITIKQAQQIINVIPPFINRVALFVNHSEKFIKNVIDSVAIDTLQFHGNETPKQCEKYNMPFIKAIKVNNNTNFSKIITDYCNCCGLLLDADSNLYGGSGETFNWSLVPITNKPIIIAGGLNKNNVVAAINTTNPYAIDVSSGVETVKGIKDIIKVRQLIKAIEDDK